MTDETQASGPEKKPDPEDDPLAIAKESKKPELDYQWFRVDDPPLRFSMRPMGEWVAVPRADMPAELSHSEGFIQRWEMRLFCRPAGVSVAAKQDGLEAALAPLRALDEIILGNGAPLRHRITHAFVTAPTNHPARDEFHRWWPATKSRIEKHKRGRVLVIHEANVPKKWRAWTRQRQYAAQWLRIVYLPREEAEMANLQSERYADWAWSKIDLYREGHIGNRARKR